MFFILLIVFLLIGGFLTFVAVQNMTTPVHITLFGWQSPTMALGLWVIAAFLLGAILLYLVAVISATGDRRELKKLREQVKTLEQFKTNSARLHALTGPLQVSEPMPTNGKTPTGTLIPMPGLRLPVQNGTTGKLLTPEKRQ